MFLGCGAGANGAWGIGGRGYHTPETSALGLNSISHGLVFSDDGWWVAAGLWTLFGLDELNAHRIDAGVCTGGIAFTASTQWVSSPVGSERRLMGAASLAGSRRFSVGVGVGVDVVSLGGFQRAHFVFADISAVIELAGPVRLVSAIERVRLDGEALPGADVAAAVVLFPGAPVCAVAELSVTRYGSLGASVGSRIRFSKRISAVFGYDQNTGTLAAAIDVGVRSIAVDAGAFFHPVLGVSRSVFVRWGWWR